MNWGVFEPLAPLKSTAAVRWDAGSPQIVVVLPRYNKLQSASVVPFVWLFLSYTISQQECDREPDVHSQGQRMARATLGDTGWPLQN